MYCPNCGKENENHEIYCLFCGRKLGFKNKENYESYEYYNKKLENDKIQRDPLGYEDLGYGYGGYLLIFIALYFGQSILGTIFYMLIEALIKAFNQIPHVTNVNLFANILSGIVCIGAFMFVMRKQIKPMLKKFVDKKVWAKTGIYFAIIYGSIIVYSIIMTILQIQQSSANQDSIDAMTAINPVLSGLYVCIFAPIIEELTFRFGLFRTLTKFGKKVAFIVVACIFAGMHLIASVQSGTLLQDLSSLPIYLIGGVTLTLAYMREKDIAVPICIHFVYNTIGFLMGLVACYI